MKKTRLNYYDMRTEDQHHPTKERNNFGYLRLTTEDNTKMAFQERRCESFDSVLLAQG
jgi:hypothetical protein